MGNPQTGIIKDDGKGYGSHIPFLEFIFKKFEVCSIIEFGLGNYSTPFFLVNCCKVISIEMQEESWFNNILNKLGKNENWHPYLSLGPDAWKHDIPLDTANADFVFVDGHLESRTDCVNRMFAANVPLIAAHDTECNVYRWENIYKPAHYRKLIFDNNGSQTTLWVREDKW
jgi:hypothetical protein